VAAPSLAPRERTTRTGPPPLRGSRCQRSRAEEEGEPEGVEGGGGGGGRSSRNGAASGSTTRRWAPGTLWRARSASDATAAACCSSLMKSPSGAAP
jgi:hypothetical protein